MSIRPLQPEELTLLLIKLRRQQAELNSIREHTVAQLMQLNMDGDHPKVRPPHDSSAGVCVRMCSVFHLYSFAISLISLRHFFFHFSLIVSKEI